MISSAGRIAIKSVEVVLEPVEMLLRSVHSILNGLASGKLRIREIVSQMFESAVLSLPVIVFSLTVVSMMSVLEFSWHMKVVLRQDALVPGFSFVLMVREVAPVVTSMLLASRMGASIAAELAFMKITDQLDQLKLLSVSEIDYLVVPRWFGCVFATVVLTLISLATAVIVSAGIASRFMGYQPNEFFNSMFVFTRGLDFWGGIGKALCFGTIIPLVSATKGFNCKGGSRGVGKAATDAVVQSCLWIIIADFILSYFIWTR
jgi:phospholipid/cholesterol/gamma-HCH transport system permease protein